jgi:hypothetical protein
MPDLGGTPYSLSQSNWEEKLQKHQKKKGKETRKKEQKIEIIREVLDIEDVTGGQITTTLDGPYSRTDLSNLARGIRAQKNIILGN